jgi:hypothetical protein
MERLHQLPNKFKSVNRIRCFNHTLQLSVKALLRPFASASPIPEPGDNIPDDDSEIVTLEEEEEEEEAEDSDDEGSREGDDEADAEGEVDEAFDGLTDEEHEQLLENTSAVCTVLNKVESILITWIAAVTN